MVYLAPSTSCEVVSVDGVRTVRYKEVDYPRSGYWAYSNVEIPGFRSFAGLAKTEEAVIRFASKYGLLGIKPLFLGRQHEQTPSARIDPVFCYPIVGDIMDGTPGAEAISDWFREIDIMAFAVRLWEAIKQPRGGKLEKLVHWKHVTRDAEEVDQAVCAIGSLVLVIAEDFPALAEFADAHDLREYVPPFLVRPARRLLQILVNRGLHYPKELKSVRIPEPPAIDYTFRMDKNTGLFRFQQEPSTLLADMWLQFARTLTGKASEPRKPDMHVCEVCGTLYEAHKAFGRYCSDACRQKHYRATKKRKNASPAKTDKK